MALAFMFAFAAVSSATVVGPHEEEVTVFTEGFENITNSFTAANGTQTNAWRLGGVATANTGTRSAYISNDGGTSNAYTITSASTVHIHRTVNFPESYAPYTLRFHWKGLGETGFDNMTVRLVAQTVTPTAGTQITSGTLLGTFNGSSTWREEVINIPSAAISGTTQRLVFTWRNDNSGGQQPPIAIDDISLTAITGPARPVVSFNLDGGAGTAPANIIVPKSTTISAAQLPDAASFTRTGFVNDGKWYTRVGINPNFIYTEFVAGETVVEEDITLFLRWSPSYDVCFSLVGFILTDVDGTPTATETVTAAGTAPRCIGVVQGSTARENQEPSTNEFSVLGHVNIGHWYYAAGIGDNRTLNRFEFGEDGTEVTSDMTLHLLWTIDTERYDSDIGGAGTLDDPFIITSPKQLAFVSLKVNEGDASYATAHYRLESDLDLSNYGANFNGGRGWIPIGTHQMGVANARSFRGTFNGNGHTISNLYINDSTLDYAGLFGYLHATCPTDFEVLVYLLGVHNANVRGRNNVGVIAGNTLGTMACEAVAGVKHSYVVGGNVSGADTVGGIVGKLGGYTTLEDSYSTVGVSGRNVVGGLAGFVGGTVGRSLALNPYVTATGLPNSSLPINVGRVVGHAAGFWEFELQENHAFVGMLNSNDNTTWTNKGLTARDGADIRIIDIEAAPTLNGSFTEDLGFSVAAGDLPGFGASIVRPPHLGGPQISVAEIDREVLQVEEIAVVAPVERAGLSLTVGPNPVERGDGVVRFFVNAELTSTANYFGNLTIFDNNGNIVRRIDVVDVHDVLDNRRAIAKWDLRDAHGRVVGEGTYLVRGALIINGRRERVSTLVGVR